VSPLRLSVLLGLALVAVEAEAWARVGGGEGFGGGGGGSSGGGSSGGGEGMLAEGLLRLLLWLLWHHPAIGVPLTLVVIAFVIFRGRSGRRDSRRTVHHHRDAPVQRAVRPPRPPPAPSFEALRARDPGLSELLLITWSQQVYSLVLRSSAKGDWAPLRPYLSPELEETLRSKPPDALDEVLIGATRIVGAGLRGDRAEVVLEFESNLVRGQGDSALRLYRRERWTLRKDADALSPGPDKMLRLVCPSCGNPAETDDAGACQSCGAVRRDGRLQWQVEARELVEERPVRPVALTLGGGVEVGTDLPTVYAKDLPEARAALGRRHPELRPAEVIETFTAIFLRVQRAWASGRWEDARPNLTDPLFSAHRLQLAQHAAQGLKNHVEDVSVLNVTVVKITHDPYYESITARIEARMRDWTTNAQGRVVGGSETKPRIFSEYWTFVRAQGQPFTEPNPEQCPSCSAPLDRVNEGGVCGYCGTKLSAAERAWVLGAITQDETYSG
jgi:predicted lipid-binding transport protein (Tim44 family)